MEIFNIHKLLFTLNYNNEIKGKKIIYINSQNQKETIIIKKIVITESHLKMNVLDDNDNWHLILFLRIDRLLDEKDELVFENEPDLKNTKIIKRV